METSNLYQPKVCALCGATYQPNSGRQKYCPTCGKQGKYGKASCDYCGKVFNRQGNTTGRYCSQECWYASNTAEELRKRPCVICGTIFKPSKPGQEACGQACGREWRKRKYARSLRTCPVCGKEFDNRHLQQITCSRKCAGVLRHAPRENDNCIVCGNPLPRDGFTGRSFCSAECRNQRVPVGSRRVAQHGYIMLKVGKSYEYPTNRGEWTFEHRYVMEQSLGRALDRRETVHHKNGDRADNRIENLELRAGQHGNGQTVSDLHAEIERLRAQIERLSS